MFNICQSEIEDANFLDICAGSGAMGLEALSRGAQSCTFIENNRSTAELLRKTISEMGVNKQCTVIAKDALKAVETLSTTTFSLIYIDPPYSKGSENPFLAELLTAIDRHLSLEKHVKIFVEARKGLSTTFELNRLQCSSRRTSGDTELLIFSMI